MFKNFKDSELLGFLISSKIENEAKKIENNKSKSQFRIVSSVFASALSIILSYTANNYLICLKNIFLELLLILSIYIATYTIVYLLFKKIIIKINEIKAEKELKSNHYTAASKKKRKDQFDNVICDNVLITKNLIDRIDFSEDKNLSTYYFFEAIYYIRISINFIDSMIADNNRTNLIRVDYDGKSIEKCRVINILYVAKNLLQKLKVNENNIAIGECDIEDVKQQISNIENILNDCLEKLNKI